MCFRIEEDCSFPGADGFSEFQERPIKLSLFHHPFHLEVLNYFKPPTWLFRGFSVKETTNPPLSVIGVNHVGNRVVWQNKWNPEGRLQNNGVLLMRYYSVTPKDSCMT